MTPVAQEPLRGSALGTSRAPCKVVFNFAFSRRLNFLQYCAMETQYQLAYLSTMGGACHLTNNIDKALVIAKQQESIAERLGSLEIKIRSRVFQAVNLGMKGDESTCKSILRECTKLATSNNWTGMGVFVKNSETWLVMNKHISAAEAVAEVRSVKVLNISEVTPRGSMSAAKSEGCLVSIECCLASFEGLHNSAFNQLALTICLASTDYLPASSHQGLRSQL